MNTMLPSKLDWFTKHRYCPLTLLFAVITVAKRSNTSDIKLLTFSATHRTRRLWVRSTRTTTQIYQSVCDLYAFARLRRLTITIVWMHVSVCCAHLHVCMYVYPDSRISYDLTARCGNTNIWPAVYNFVYTCFFIISIHDMHITPIITLGCYVHYFAVRLQIADM